MALSNKYGHLLLTTGNKSEIAMGYCTLYGDMAGGFSVLKDVTKTMAAKVGVELLKQDPETLKELAKQLGIELPV